MSHQDVVPAEGEWLHPPFSGDIADGKVWGRGTSDTKCSVMAFFQAAEELLAQGYVPPQDVYLSSSCTEEWAGPGCPKLVDELRRRGVRPWLVWTRAAASSRSPSAASMGISPCSAYLKRARPTCCFTAKSNGGHACAPAEGTPIARLAAFVHEMETKHPFRRRMPPEVAAMFETLAPYASFPLRFVLGNLWLFRPLLLRVMPMISAQGGAMLQTTIAFTMLSGSGAFNVMPQQATLGANMRFIPHQGMDESLAIVRKAGEKYELTMEVITPGRLPRPPWTSTAKPSAVWPPSTKTFPGLPASPYVMTGATDARFYQEICDNVIRFAPVIYGPEQMKGMHGVNENIEYSCLPGAVDFYKNLIAMVFWDQEELGQRATRTSRPKKQDPSVELYKSDAKQTIDCLKCKKFKKDKIVVFGHISGAPSLGTPVSYE